ncbi:GNAT family N-acetyltransferase [Litoribrevibacter albus]|uniref:N-acetyltransferase n=1 Tax=Litoribrevibacter albus TaxID=1473156 RepID=A0AA37S753_9GAMM|nr:GNAT family N-acetyltransferase [Litoribrevibacter albus]GLQ30345.1 N-acetyltransferase [Litoribrevibacter albus]
MIQILLADYQNAQHAQDLVFLLNQYACHPMGGGSSLKESTSTHLIDELGKRPYAFSLLAYDGDRPVGLANCFEGFSTFKCLPLINIHDIYVESDYRGSGVSQQLLDKIEVIARDKGCCKITLEVLEGNIVAQKAYRKVGFEGYELDPKMGKALFWEKSLF